MIEVLKEIKKIKANRLVSIACFPNEKGFRIYYHFSLGSKPELKQFSIEIKKGEEIESILPLHKNALLFEAEITEIHKINFIGNELCGKRLFRIRGGPNA